MGILFRPKKIISDLLVKFHSHKIFPATFDSWVACVWFWDWYSTRCHHFQEWCHEWGQLDVLAYWWACFSFTYCRLLSLLNFSWEPPYNRFCCLFQLVRSKGFEVIVRVCACTLCQLFMHYSLSTAGRCWIKRGHFPSVHKHAEREEGEEGGHARSTKNDVITQLNIQSGEIKTSKGAIDPTHKRETRNWPCRGQGAETSWDRLTMLEGGNRGKWREKIIQVKGNGKEMAVSYVNTLDTPTKCDEPEVVVSLSVGKCWEVGDKCPKFLMS